jgi:hypothetical protein
MTARRHDALPDFAKPSLSDEAAGARIDFERAITMNRRDVLKATAATLGIGVVAALDTNTAFAHHGWAWATDEQFEITGKITKVKLGNPHGELMLDAKGVAWEAEIGQPWRNKRAGLTDNLLKIGVEVTISGHRAKDPKVKVVKAERVIINGKSYNLYPDRGV